MGRVVQGGFEADFPDHTAEQLYAIAADIESYPRFVPWCIATRIIERRADHWWCDNLFGAGPLRLRFHTRAVPQPPAALDISSSDGPFDSFALSWRFTPLDGRGCAVGARFRMVFRHDIARLIARASMAEAERRIIAAFRRRAEALYGAAA